MDTPVPTFGSHLMIRSPHATGRTTRVWLNGQEITKSLTGVTLTMGDGDVTRAELSIRVDGVDVDARTLAALFARLDPVEQAELRQRIAEEVSDAE